MVSRPADTAVSASISTPVRPSVSAVTSIRIAGAGVVERELDRHAGQRQRMAQRDQVRRALGRLDRGDPRDPEHVALFRVARAHHRQRGRAHLDAAAGARDTFGYILVGDVDHVRLPVRVEVGKMLIVGRFRERRTRGADDASPPRACRRSPLCRSGACHVRTLR